MHQPFIASTIVSIVSVIASTIVSTTAVNHCNQPSHQPSLQPLSPPHIVIITFFVLQYYSLHAYVGHQPCDCSTLALSILTEDILWATVGIGIECRAPQPVGGSFLRKFHHTHIAIVVFFARQLTCLPAATTTQPLHPST